MGVLTNLNRSLPQSAYNIDIPIKSLPESIKLYDLDLNPEYQRGYVWTEKQQSLFVGSFILNPRAMQPFWFRRIFVPDQNGGREIEGKNWKSSQVVDGKQRINACMRWLNGEIPAIIETHGVTVYFKNLDDIDNRYLSFNASMRWNFVDLDDKNILLFYLMLNGGGVKHSKQELERVRKLYYSI